MATPEFHEDRLIRSVLAAQLTSGKATTAGERIEEEFGL